MLAGGFQTRRSCMSVERWLLELLQAHPSQRRRQAPVVKDCCRDGADLVGGVLGCSAAEALAGSSERGGAIAVAVALASAMGRKSSEIMASLRKVALREQGTLASSRLVGLVMVTTKV